MLSNLARYFSPTRRVHDTNCACNALVHHGHSTQTCRPNMPPCHCDTTPRKGEIFEATQPPQPTNLVFYGHVFYASSANQIFFVNIFLPFTKKPILHNLRPRILHSAGGVGAGVAPEKIFTHLGANRTARPEGRILKCRRHISIAIKTLPRPCSTRQLLVRAGESMESGMGAIHSSIRLPKLVVTNILACPALDY